MTEATEAEKVVAELRGRIGSEFDGELHLSEDEANTLFALIESQRAELARLTDGEILDMRMASGAIDLTVTSKALEHLALVLTEHFRESEAKNYIELSLHAKTEPFESYVVTVQKRNGAKTPHELRQAAEARVTALEAEKAGYRTALQDIANQKTVNELCAEFGRDYETNWEGGYEGCIERARQALAQPSTQENDNG